MADGVIYAPEAEFHSAYSSIDGRILLFCIIRGGIISSKNKTFNGVALSIVADTKCMSTFNEICTLVTPNRLICALSVHSY